ncbi:acyl-CoA/acyl-ACP dehydrogenase [Streptomyces sp. NBC_01239]|uniref:acyl-CoA dehydrogenase family protein n=1 Tax=Streptomyces sp. NBC_01239 TaxID=2903792 RepID=UPI00225B18B3|nr:acyl-CoA dehydrogenase family protein [Streptomyces sp. NBC_01239]MCX4815204.1 acyl-CoA/acyl-ACP dehydrogenase [Streptomyces sp. NBC_01239]
MSLSLTEEQEELRLLVRGFLDDKAVGHRPPPPGPGPEEYDPDIWRQLSAQLGLAGLVVPEKYGGTGLSPAELGIVLEELGRSLYPGPFFATVVLAVQTLTRSGDAAAMEHWLPGVASGELTATLASVEPDGSWAADALTTVAEPGRGGWTLSGTKTYVVDGCTADLLLVTARCADGVGVFALPPDSPGLTRTPLDALDLTRPLARIRLDGTPARRIGDGDASGWLAGVYDLVRAAVSAEQVGGAAECLDMAVAHATTREQFGRPIGSFQAIKHKCAELLVEVECARSAARFAGPAVATPGTEASIAAAVARSYCSQAFTHAAKENIQIHGGIGFTWEHRAHLYLRRAKSSELLFGTPREERARLTRLTRLTEAGGTRP